MARSIAARHVGDGTWISLVPETGPDRARDVLRGLEHERALWSAPEPHATTVHALTALVRQPELVLDPGDQVAGARERWDTLAVADDGQASDVVRMGV